MGAWGSQFNENDGALDFLGELSDSKNWAAVEAQLHAFVEDGGYEDGEEAFAAAEMVAAAIGKPSPLLDPELATWAVGKASNPSEARELAARAADLLSTESELNELWSEADEYAEWQASVENLKSRLG